jgi:hypothetical protein
MIRLSTVPSLGRLAQPLLNAEGTRCKVLATFTRMPRPECGLDCLTCAEFTRWRLSTFAQLAARPSQESSSALAPAWPTISKVTFWVCGTHPSTWARKKTQARQIGQPKYSARGWCFALDVTSVGWSRWIVFGNNPPPPGPPDGPRHGPTVGFQGGAVSFE